jgi:hypothetical protein
MGRMMEGCGKEGTTTSTMSSGSGGIVGARALAQAQPPQAQSVVLCGHGNATGERILPAFT